MRRTVFGTMVAASLVALYTAPTSAQLVHRPSAAPYGATAADGTSQGIVMERFGSVGLNADRAQAFGSGLRLLPHEGGYVGYRFGNNWSVGSALHRNEDIDSSTWLDMGARYDFEINRRNRISFDGGVSFRAPMDAPTIGDPLAFNAPSGAEPGAGFRLSWRYSFGQDHYVSTILGFDRRFGAGLYDGADAERSAATFGTVYGYRFR